jgi:hypothetical protein
VCGSAWCGCFPRIYEVPGTNGSIVYLPESRMDLFFFLVGQDRGNVRWTGQDRAGLGQDSTGLSVEPPGQNFLQDFWKYRLN